MTASRPLRIALRVLIATLLLCVAVIITAYWFLQRNPEALVNSALGEVARKHGLEFRMTAVDVTLLPLPSVAVSGVAVQGADFQCSVAYMTVQPDLLALLSGSFSPWAVCLVRPRLTARLADASGQARERWRLWLKTLTQARGAAQDGIADAPGAGTPAAMPNGPAPNPLGFLKSACSLEIVQGAAELRGPAGENVALGGLQCRLRGEPSGRISGTLQLASLHLEMPDGLSAGLQHLRLEGKSDLVHPLTATPALTLSGTLSLPERVPGVRTRLEFHGQPGGWNALFSMNGEYAPDGVSIPFGLSGEAALPAGGDVVTLRGVMLAADADSGRFDGTLRLPGQGKGPALDGRLLIHRVSLTQWLGFARNLAPGLQLALDNVLEGSIDFHLDEQGLEAQRISAVCTGARFTGRGGVPRWSAPVVDLDLSSETVNLDLSIPESVGRPPEAVRFFHPPLTPLPGEPLKPGETGIGYDIRLGAKEVRYGPLLLGPATVRIHPGKLDKNGLEDVLIDADSRFYGGTFKGRCILGGARELPYAITAEVRNVNGAPLARDMPLLPIRAGRFQADVNIQSKSRSLDVFLDKLRGKLTVRGDKGRFATQKAPGGVAFTTLDLELALRSGIWRTPRLGLDGRWRLNLATADLESDLTLDGRLWFGETAGKGGGGVEFQKVPANGTLRLNPGFSGLARELRATWRGSLNCQSALAQLSAADLRVEALGLTAEGSLNVEDWRKLQWSGALRAQCPNLAHTLELLGAGSVRVPAWLRRFSLSADVSHREGALSLRTLDARGEGLSAAGALTLTRRNDRPFVEFSLSSPSLDMTRLAGAEPKAVAARPQTGGLWRFPVMRTFDARGELRVKNFSGWRFRMQNLALPLELSHGLLTLGPASARFYGATLHSRATLDFRDALAFNSSVAVTDFDFGAAARDRKLDATLTGRASLEAGVRASGLGPGRLPGALDGTWRFSVRNGSWQTHGKDGAPKGKPTLFSLASASGTLDKGVARSSNFLLKGPTLKVTGGGAVNLVTQDMDCNFTVDMQSLPEFPLHLYGSMSKPKTSIGAGTLILNTLGGITKGFVDVLGGIVDGAWRLFR